MSHCRHFCPLFSSPAALLPLCSATALFTLFKILPLPSPLCNILSFLPFLSPDQFSSPYPFPFSQPLSLRAPSSFPPFFDPSNPPMSFLCVCLSPLHVACVGKVAEGGGRRPELAALAACIIHVPCSLRGSRYSAGFSLGHTGITPLCTGQWARWKSRADGDC